MIMINMLWSTSVNHQQLQFAPQFEMALEARGNWKNILLLKSSFNLFSGCSSWIFFTSCISEAAITWYSAFSHFSTHLTLHLVTMFPSSGTLSYKTYSGSHLQSSRDCSSTNHLETKSKRIASERGELSQLF